MQRTSNQRILRSTVSSKKELTLIIKQEEIIMNGQEKYITEKEVTEITGRALSTLRNERFLGKGIPYIKIGKSVRYRLDDVIEFMESRRIETYQ